MTQLGSTRTVLGAVALVVVATTGLVACGGGDSDTATPSALASTSPGSAGATPAPPSSAAPSGASAATGVALALTGLSLHLPDGWQTQTTGTTSANGFDPTLDAGEGQLMVYDDTSLSSDTVDSAARGGLRSDKTDGTHPVRGPDQTVGGVEGYVITGSSKDTPTYFEYGTVTGGRTVKIIIQFLRKTPDPQATIDSILASVTWG